jgi:hypothetical protein
LWGSFSSGPFTKISQGLMQTMALNLVMMFEDRKGRTYRIARAFAQFRPNFLTLLKQSKYISYHPVRAAIFGPRKTPRGPRKRRYAVTLIAQKKKIIDRIRTSLPSRVPSIWAAIVSVSSLILSGYLFISEVGGC